MKVSITLLVIAAVLLVTGICLDGLVGLALVTVANVCSFTALARTIRRGRKPEVGDDERQ